VVDFTDPVVFEALVDVFVPFETKGR